MKQAIRNGDTLAREFDGTWRIPAHDGDVH